jgi:hypothetical protein
MEEAVASSLASPTTAMLLYRPSRTTPGQPLSPMTRLAGGSFRHFMNRPRFDSRRRATHGASAASSATRAAETSSGLPATSRIGMAYQNRADRGIGP